MDRDEAYAAAEELKNAGKIEEAVAALDAVVAQDPDFALAYSALAAVVHSTRATRQGCRVRKASL